MAEPFIRVMNIAQIQSSGTADLTHHYDADEGHLQMPEHIRIGLKTWDGDLITTYEQQVGEYDIWLEDQVKEQNTYVLTEIDDIYNQAIRPGVILVVKAAPTPFMTHAHKIKDLILKLAGNQEDELQSNQA